MDKRTEVLERAKLRLAQAEQNASQRIDKQLQVKMVAMMVNKWEENGLSFFIDDVDLTLIVATLKHIKTHH